MNRIVLVHEFGICASGEAEGRKLYTQISEHLNAFEPVLIDFSGIVVADTSFLGASIADLYGVFPAKTIDSLLSFKFDWDWREKMVLDTIDHAKHYFGVENE